GGGPGEMPCASVTAGTDIGSPHLGHFTRLPAYSSPTRNAELHAEQDAAIGINPLELDLGLANPHGRRNANRMQAFFKLAFQRGRLSRPPSFLREETAQRLAAAVGEDAGHDLAAVVEAAVAGDLIETVAGARFGIGGAVNDQGNAGQDD